ncbi:MAG: hypothetical protein FJW23_15800 [Acidimicrobiia bacterium]|nr:hypothetical protein [Acidimicrobiia bacterium]
MICRTHTLLALTALAALLGLSSAPAAHEGHEHKVMGTVSALEAHQLGVKATDGATSTITLNAKTTILRGKTKVAEADIRTGERVVVTYTESKGKDGKTARTATEVRLGAAGG